MGFVASCIVSCFLLDRQVGKSNFGIDSLGFLLIQVFQHSLILLVVNLLKTKRFHKVATLSHQLGVNALKHFSRLFC